MTDDRTELETGRFVACLKPLFLQLSRLNNGKLKILGMDVQFHGSCSKEVRRNKPNP